MRKLKRCTLRKSSTRSTKSKGVRKPKSPMASFRSKFGMPVKPGVYVATLSGIRMVDGSKRGDQVLISNFSLIATALRRQIQKEMVAGRRTSKR